MGVIAVAVCREKVAFEPEDNPLQKTLIKYEWSETLCKKGLLQCRKELRNRLWNEDNYAPYPHEYSGSNLTALADHKNIFSFIAVPGVFRLGLKENYIFTSAFSKSA
jgi:hypothetical protein